MSKIAKSIAVLGVVAGLGVAALPLSTYAEQITDTEDVTIQLTIANEINLEVDEPDVTLSGSGTNVLYTADAIKVDADTTVATGLTVTMAASTDEGTKNALINESDTEIVSSTFDSSSYSATDSAWGYKVVEGAKTAATDFTAVPASGNVTIISDTGKAGAASAFVKFGAYIVAGQQAGTYEGQVTITATAGAN